MFAAFALLLVVVVYRIISGFYGSSDFTWLHNFAPVAAVALCGAVYLPRRVAIALPLLMLLISDVVLNAFHYHQPLLTFDILPRYVALGLISTLGFALRGRTQLPGLLGASAAGSLIFYVLTNTGSWLHEPGYTKTAAGWLQAMTSGLPGFPPTWWFYRHTLLSDLCFTLLFYACLRATGRGPAQPAPERTVLVS
jgi:hypothetical protein